MGVCTAQNKAIFLLATLLKLPSHWSPKACFQDFMIDLGKSTKLSKP